MKGNQSGKDKSAGCATGKPSLEQSWTLGRPRLQWIGKSGDEY